MNFLVFRDFSRIFLNFFGFILNLFIFKINKNIFFIYHVDMALRLRVDTWRHMRAPRVTHVCASFSTRLSG